MSIKKHWNDVKELKSTDTDVMKYIFTKEDAIAEAVLYKYGTFEERTVMCISTQTGCPMGCTFCGTGKFFGRDLTRYEIMSQVDHMIRVNNIPVERVKKMQIMVMSMGEPVLNAHNVADAFKYFDFMYPNAQLLISSSGPRSRLGWERIFDIAEQLPQVGLQFSVHESTDKARNKIMPMKAKLSLNEIAGMGEEFHRRTGRRPFFNYCVHQDNSSKGDAKCLATLFTPSIWEATLSVICESDQAMSDAVQDQEPLVNMFSSRLLEHGFNTRCFNPAGQDDIGGGCGQLWAVQEFASKNEHFKQSPGNVIHVKETQ